MTNLSDYNESKIDIADEYEWLRNRGGVFSNLMIGEEHRGNPVWTQLRVMYGYRSIYRMLSETHRMPDGLWLSIKQVSENTAVRDKCTPEYYERRTIEDIIRWKKIFKKTVEVFRGIEEGVDEDLAAQFMPYTTGWVNNAQLDNNSGRMTLTVCFDVAATHVEVKGKLYQIGACKYTQMVHVKEYEGAILVEAGDTTGQKLGTAPVNPHCSQGIGGYACLGGFGIPLAESLTHGDWFGLRMTFHNYHRTVDPNDAYGQAIVRFPQSWYKMVDGKKTIVDTVEQGELVRGGWVLDPEDWVKCHVTGKIIKRENATRIPVYLSDEALRQWTKWPSVKNMVNNLADIDRLTKAADRAWRKARKGWQWKTMHEKAMFMESQAKIATERLRTQVLEGDIENHSVSRLVTQGRSNRLNRGSVSPRDNQRVSPRGFRYL